MNPAAQAPALHDKLRSQLLDRRSRLNSALTDLDEPQDLVRLLTQVDAALSRLDSGSIGVCDFCHESIDEPELLANPTTSYCLCRLSPEQQTALERDLDLAWRVQSALLPPPDLAVSGWETHYRYLPHGAVSGDYCDLIVSSGDGANGLYFMLGDVSGKGVAASILMAHLNAALRSLAQGGLSPQEMLARANRILSESTLSSHYVTLVCGRATPLGEVEIVNAGHCAPIVMRSDGGAEVLHEGGLPLGLAAEASSESHYPVQRVVLRGGDALALYTDGVTETTNGRDEEYGVESLLDVLRSHRRDGPRKQIAECLSDLQSFCAGEPRSDDLTMLVMKRN